MNKNIEPAISAVDLLRRFESCMTLGVEVQTLSDIYPFLSNCLSGQI